MWSCYLLGLHPDVADRARAEAAAVLGDRPPALADLASLPYCRMVADEILRARFRNSFEKPEPVPAGKTLKYAIDLHTNAHAFRKGHRIMVQVQSTWFPVIDRNPQKFIPNIFEAKESDFIKATHKIYFTSQFPSYIELPVMK